MPMDDLGLKRTEWQGPVRSAAMSTAVIKEQARSEGLPKPLRRCPLVSCFSRERSAPSETGFDRGRNDAPFSPQSSVSGRTLKKSEG